MEHFTITSRKVVGTHPDGTPQLMWTEGPRVFIEGYGYTQTRLGYKIGCVEVREITPSLA
ncbi:MAG: hypothetical protein RLZZ481_379 [Pseudomonadota bacterium]|jgi:hypothetical protein